LQAIAWILELYSVAVGKMSEGTGDSIAEQAVQADLRELQDTAKVFFCLQGKISF
jgi:hypothetical protein